MKKYISPAIQCRQVEMTGILAGSPNSISFSPKFYGRQQDEFVGGTNKVNSDADETFGNKFGGAIAGNSDLATNDD